MDTVLGMMPPLLAAAYAWFAADRALRLFDAFSNPQRRRLASVIIAVAVGSMCISLSWITAIFIGYAFAVAVCIDAVFYLAVWAMRRLRARMRPVRGLQMVHRFLVVPLLASSVIIAWGTVNFSRVSETVYDVASSKLDSDYTVVFLSDTHISSDGRIELLRQKADEISRKNPDLFVICGDIVDHKTTREQLFATFKALGSVRAKLGVYYVYGNHDRQDFLEDKDRDYTEDDLLDALKANGITLLQDAALEIGEDLLLAGREDYGWLPEGERASTADLVAGRADRFVIVADHQPVDLDENAEAHVDLQISGHTHAGQLWPFGLARTLVLSDYHNYGEYHRGGCTLIVSSGFGGWGAPVRTEEGCEYVTVRLHSDK